MDISVSFLGARFRFKRPDVAGWIGDGSRDPVVDRTKAGGIDAIDMLPPDGIGSDQRCFQKYCELLGDGRLADCETTGNFCHSLWTRLQKVQYRAACVVRDGMINNILFHWFNQSYSPWTGRLQKNLLAVESACPTRVVKRFRLRSVSSPKFFSNLLVVREPTCAYVSSSRFSLQDHRALLNTIRRCSDRDRRWWLRFVICRPSRSTDRCGRRNW